MEILDSFVFAIGGIVSGHSLKHVIAAAAICLVVRMLKYREPAGLAIASGSPQGVQNGPLLTLRD